MFRAASVLWDAVGSRGKFTRRMEAAKPPPQGEVPSEARRKGAIGYTENTRQGWTLAEIEAAVVPPSVGSADSSPPGGSLSRGGIAAVFRDTIVGAGVPDGPFPYICHSEPLQR